jgi:transcriptional regulator with XRE-family HTH domain
MIARTLRHARFRACLTQGQVAKAAGISPATVHRYETWRDSHIFMDGTVQAIARTCGAPEAARRCLSELVAGQDNGWWSDSDVPADQIALLSFEAAAQRVELYSGGVVPELLQTPRYAWALRRETGKPCRPYEKHPDGDGSRRRRLATLGRHSFHFTVVLDEALLRREVGGREVMAEQCEHLMALAHRQNVDLQVLPFSAGHHPAATWGPFSIVTWKDPEEPVGSLGVVHQEGLRGGTYLDDPGDVLSYRGAFVDLRARAADQAVTRYMLAGARQFFSGPQMRAGAR